MESVPLAADKQRPRQAVEEQPRHGGIVIPKIGSLEMNPPRMPPLRMAVAGMVIVAAFAAAAAVRPRGIAPPVEHDAANRPSRHAAPPADVAALNAAEVAARRVPDPLVRVILPDERPAVVIFLKAGCGCSEEFARMFSAVASSLAGRASCLAVIDAADGDATAFVASTALATPHLVESGAGLAAAWGVTKAGCVALVRPGGDVEAIWPGISRQGFRDLAARIGTADLLPAASLALLPGAATAGCPLTSATLVTQPGVSP